MHAHVRNPKQRVELQQKPQLESSTRGAAGGSSRLRAKRLACASHCTPLLSRRSSSSVVRASLARSATSIAALPRARRFAHWFNLLGGRGQAPPPQTPPLLDGPWPPHDTARPGWGELASLAPYATSIAALERCQGSPAWMDRAARPPVNAAASSSTAAFAALPPLCEAYAASAG